MDSAMRTGAPCPSSDSRGFAHVWMITCFWTARAFAKSSMRRCGRRAASAATKAIRCALRRQLMRLFTDPRGPGLPEPRRTNGNLRAALIPHIDYPRGGVTYAWGFKEVVEQTDASLFVIIGTSHYSGHRFTLTRKDFETPLGIAPTDQGYIDRLVKHHGPDCLRTSGSPICRSIPSSWKWFFCNTSTRASARSASCLWSSALFTIA